MTIVSQIFYLRHTQEIDVQCLHLKTEERAWELFRNNPPSWTRKSTNEAVLRKLIITVLVFEHFVRVTEPLSKLVATNTGGVFYCFLLLVLFGRGVLEFLWSFSANKWWLRRKPACHSLRAWAFTVKCFRTWVSLFIGFTAELGNMELPWPLAFVFAILEVAVSYQSKLGSLSKGS